MNSIQIYSHEQNFIALFIELGSRYCRSTIVRSSNTEVHNTTSFESSVLAGVLNVAVESRLSYTGHTGLRGPTWRIPGYPLAVAARGLDVFSAHISIGDFVLRASSAGRVAACVCEQDEFLLIVEPMAKISAISSHGDRWRFAGDAVAWMADHVELPLAWLQEDGGTFVILRL